MERKRRHMSFSDRFTDGMFRQVSIPRLGLFISLSVRPVDVVSASCFSDSKGSWYVGRHVGTEEGGSVWPSVQGPCIRTCVSPRDTCMCLFEEGVTL